MKLIKIISKLLTDIMLCILVMAAVFSLYAFAKSKQNSNYIPGIGPYKFMAVLSGSMSPTFNVYDMIVDKKINSGDLKIGDIVTVSQGTVLVTHRIVNIEEKDGKKLFIMRGDANNVEDQNPVTPDRVQAKYIFRIPYMGLVLSKIRGPIGIGVIWMVFVFFTMAEFIPEFIEKKKSIKKAKEDCDSDETLKYLEK